MKQIYNQVVALLNKHVPEYHFTLNVCKKQSYIYIWDGKEYVYVIAIDEIVSSSKIVNPNSLYRICLIIIESKIGV